METRFAETPFGQIRYTMAGTGADFLLLPGTGQSHALFERQIGALASRLRVIAIDTPGNPGSPILPDPVSIPRLAESVAATMDALRIARAHVYGIHLGNKIGAALAAEWPDRVARFVFSGQSHSIIADNDARNDYVRRITRHHFGDAGGDPAKLAMRQLYEANFAYDLDRDLRRMPCPTLIVEIATPEEDRLLGRQGPALLKVIPQSRLATFEAADGLGHTLDDRAEDLARAIFDFLA